jgi:hypothetical protein
MAQAQEVFLFQPTSVSGCQLWLDAADVNGNGLSPVNDSSVSIWVDKSGNGRSVSQGTLLNQPTNLNIRGINYINFTSANTNFLSNTSMNIDYRTSQIFLVFQRKSVQSNNGVFCPLANANSGADWTNTNEFVITTLTEVASAGSGTNDGQSGNLNLTTYQFVINNNSLTTFRDFGGTSVITRNMGLTTSPTALYIGRRRDGVSLLPANILFGEALVYNKLLSDNENQQIEGYLAWKWGLQANLPATHPFRNYRPLAVQPIPTQVPNMPLVNQEIQPYFPITRNNGCQLWLDAADSSSVLLSGSNVTQWNDKSGNGYNLTQATTSNQPLFSTNSIQFVSNRFLNIPQASINNASTYSILLVINPVASLNWIFVKQHDGFNTYNVLSMTNNTTTGGLNQAGTTGFLYWRTINTGTQASSGTALSTSTPQMIELIFDGGNLIMYRNGTQMSSTGGSFAISNVTNATNFTLGAWIQGVTYNNSEVTNFFLNEILFFNASLSTTQRQQVEGYLAWKWGLQASLPSTHPYKNRQIAPFAYTTVPTPISVGIWIPTRITSINAWFDGADPLGTGTAPGLNTTLATWFDKSGNGRNASGGVSPTFVSGGVSFNGSSQFYTMSIPYSQNYSIFLVATNTSVSQCYFFARNALGGGREPTFIQGFVTATTLEWYEGADRGTIVSSPSSPFMASIDHYQAVNIVGWYFGEQTMNIAQTRAYNATAWDTLGQSGINVNYYGGTMKELIFYNTALTTQQRQQVEGYLAWKWGLVSSLPANHPYKRWPPSP